VKDSYKTRRKSMPPLWRWDDVVFLWGMRWSARHGRGSANRYVRAVPAFASIAQCRATPSSRSEYLPPNAGKKLRQGAVGVEFKGRAKATFIHRLNVFPYPIEDVSFGEISGNYVLELLDCVLGVLRTLIVLAAEVLTQYSFRCR
jgi:hypothetical protein